MFIDGSILEKRKEIIAKGDITITVVDSASKAVDLSSLSADAEISFDAVLLANDKLDKAVKVTFKWNNTSKKFEAVVASK